MHGECTIEEPIVDAFQNFEVQVYNKILDTTIESLKSRFEKNEALYKDLACLSPLHFDEVKIHMPFDAMKKLSEILVRFDEKATKENYNQS